MKRVASEPTVRRIGEIGFNAGLSSAAFLEANHAATVSSFDLGEYDYIKKAKRYIDEQFPGRHELIIGDSRKTVPAFAESNKDTQFDVIFIDGGHDYDIAMADIMNMRQFAHANTKLLIDDLTPWKPWGEGPTRVWRELIDRGEIEQHDLWRDGVKVSNIAPPGERSWALGRYIFPNQ